MSSYVIIDRKKGTITRVTCDGGKERRESLVSKPRRTDVGPEGGYWQRSLSNGIIGTEAAIKKQMAINKKLGVSIEYRKVKEHVNHFGEKVAVYLPEFTDRVQKRNWLKANKRVDIDAGYGDPCPGDFRDNVQPEFHGFNFSDD